jgi:hypothetical protein
MRSSAFVLPILPGKEDACKRFVQEMTGPRRNEYEASRHRLGLTTDRLYLQHTPQGALLIVYGEMDQPEQISERLATSQDPFDVWFRQQVQDIHGVDLTQPPPGPPPEQILEWQAR